MDYLPDDNFFLGSWTARQAKKQKAAKSRKSVAMKRRPVPVRKATRKNFLSMLKRARMAGIDYTDEELMGAGISDLVNKIRSVVRNAKGVQLQSGSGNISLSKSGLSLTDTVDPGVQEQYQLQAQADSGVSGLVKNPLFLAAAGLAAFMLLRGKR